MKFPWNMFITKNSGRRWRDKELSVTKQNNTIAMTDTRRKKTITEEQPLNGQQLTLSSLHTSKDTFANSLDQNEMAEPLIRSYTASHSFINLWQNTYLQQWMCPNSEMKEPFSETQGWEDSTYWGWVGFNPVWLTRNFTRFSWSSPSDKYKTRNQFKQTIMSQDTAFSSSLHMRPAKTRVILRRRTDWAESSLPAWNRFGSLVTNWEQSDLTLRWAHMQSCGKWCDAAQIKQTNKINE